MYVFASYKRDYNKANKCLDSFWMKSIIDVDTRTSQLLINSCVTLQGVVKCCNYQNHITAILMSFVWIAGILAGIGTNFKKLKTRLHFTSSTTFLYHVVKMFVTLCILYHITAILTSLGKEISTELHPIHYWSSSAQR